MNRVSLRKSVVVFISLSLCALGYPGAASAGFIGTDDYLTAQNRQARIERVQAALMRENVSGQLAALGVDPEQARQRVAALPNSDLVLLDERLEELPAGGGLLELVVVAFLIILILDLTGLTNIFPGIGPGKVR
jgi:hypothetical protein